VDAAGTDIEPVSSYLQDRMLSAISRSTEEFPRREGGAMADETDVLLELWKDHRAANRQVESQRATLTNIIIVSMGAGLGFLAQKGLQTSMLMPTRCPYLWISSASIEACGWHRHGRSCTNSCLPMTCQPDWLGYPRMIGI
jgi:hypothetical protein